MHIALGIVAVLGAVALIAGAITGSVRVRSCYDSPRQDLCLPHGD